MHISDTQLIILSLSIALCGLALLFFAQLVLKNTALTYEEFTQTPQDTKVVLEGRVKESVIRANTTLITLQTVCEIPLVLFEPKEIQEQTALTVIGQKKYYKGAPEILAEEVKIHDATLS